MGLGIRVGLGLRLSGVEKYTATHGMFYPVFVFNSNNFFQDHVWPRRRCTPLGSF